MLPMDAIVGVVFLLAGILQGLTGFGSALLAVPLLTLALDVKAAVPLVSLGGLALTTLMCLRLRGHLDRGRILPLFIGCVPGVVTGVLILKHVPAGGLRAGIGAFLLCYAAYGLFARPRPLHMPGWVAYAAGYSTGLIGASFSAGGPPVVVYTSLTGWPKDTVRATLSGFFQASGLLVVASHAIMGMITGETLRFSLAAVPAVLLGTELGLRGASRMREETYRSWLFGLLAAMGLLMLVKP